MYQEAKLVSLFTHDTKKASILDLMVHHPHISDAQLQMISCPVLVLCGSEDMIKVEHSMHIAKKIPHAILDIVPGDHFLAKKNNQIVNQHVQSFLQQNI